MSRHEYEAAIELYNRDVPFYGLIMAAMLKADTKNVVMLRVMFEPTWRELDARYNAPGGILPTDPDAQPFPGRVA